MDTYHDWHLIRGVALLVVLGAFILHAFLIGAWQSRKATRDASRMTEQDAQLSGQRKTLFSADNRETEQRQDRSIVGHEKRAA